jgi:hypothetical protein
VDAIAPAIFVQVVPPSDDFCQVYVYPEEVLGQVPELDVSVSPD